MQNFTKDQHIVPVCYLKNFSDESERGNNPKVWRYDKLSRRSEYKGVKSFCYSHKIYSIKSTSEAIIDDSITDKETFFESHYLKGIEQEYSEFLKEVIDCLSNRKFKGPQKQMLSTYIAVQFLRDPIIKGQCNLEGDPFYDLPDDYQKILKEHPELKEDPSMMHYMYAYGNKDLISTMARSMVTSKWKFYCDINGGFYTSDTPVCLGLDEMSEGIMEQCILFPISKNFLLQIQKGYQINEIEYVDNTPQWRIDKLNFLQVYFAKKYVVCSKNTFERHINRIDDTCMWDLKKMDVFQ